jgi:hypothetical protein
MKGASMKHALTFMHTRIITVLPALCAVVILAFAVTATVSAKNTLNSPTKQTIPKQPNPPQASCGTVNAHEGTPPIVFNGQAATNAEACFWQVYQHCQAKTLVFYIMGVDTGTNNTLWTLKQKGVCAIADLVSYYSASVKLANHSFFIICGKMQKEQQGLIVSGCGNNADLIVPAPTPTPLT